MSLITRYKTRLFSDKELFAKVSAMEKQVTKIHAEIFAITENAEISCMSQGIMEHYYKEQDRTEDKYKVKSAPRANAPPQAQSPINIEALKYDINSLDKKLKNLKEMALGISRDGR